MPISDVLQQMRSGSPMSEPGLQSPTFDPILVIASLFGPEILRSLVGRAGAALAPEAEQGFSQADLLAARLQAAARQQAPQMKAEALAAPLMDNPYVTPMRGGRGADVADIGFKIPQEARDGNLPIQSNDWMEMLNTLMARGRN
jgi:hypothetical protein